MRQYSPLLICITSNYNIRGNSIQESLSIEIQPTWKSASGYCDILKYVSHKYSVSGQFLPRGCEVQDKKVGFAFDPIFHNTR